MKAEELFKAVADKSRLKILALLIDKPKFVEELAMELNISVSTVSFHLKKLLAVGLVACRKIQYYQEYFVNSDELKKTLSEIISSERESTSDCFRLEVLKEFFSNGKGKLPVQIKKRQIIYGEIAKHLTKNKNYSLREINLTIADFLDDFTSARNEMVEMGILNVNGDNYSLA